MIPTDTFDAPVAVIRETFGDDTLTIDSDTTATDFPGWDSVAHVELMIAVEERFGIRFTTGEAAGMTDVGDMAEFIERHLQSKLTPLRYRRRPGIRAYRRASSTATLAPGEV